MTYNKHTLKYLVSDHLIAENLPISHTARRHVDTSCWYQIMNHVDPFIGLFPFSK